MNYTEALSYLDVINERYGISYGLDTVTKLFNIADNPEKHTKVIHVAGTNGKGSVSSFIAFILSAAGYKVGRYISPAVYGYREKVQCLTDCHAEYISEDEAAGYISEIKEYSDKLYEKENIYPSAFEIETVMAFLAFKDWQCDYAVVECGMGGRLDATNAISDKELCVFASISEDHKTYLGDTISDIAFNKAGIMRKDVCAVSAAQSKEVKFMLEKCAACAGCNITFAGNYTVKDTGVCGSRFIYRDKEWNIRLCGAFQIDNAVTAIEAVYAMRKNADEDVKNKLSENVIKKGLYETKWQGRFEVLNDFPYVIADGAHNPDAVKKLVDSIDTLFPHQNYKRIGVAGIFKDKDIDRMLNIMSGCFDEMHTVTPPGARGMNACVLADKTYDVLKIKTTAHTDMCADEVAEEIICGIDECDKDKTVVVIFGSLSLRSKN